MDRNTVKLTANAKEWETNIDEIVSLTNENLAALERARQSLKPVIQQNDKKVGINNMPAMKLLDDKHVDVEIKLSNNNRLRAKSESGLYLYRSSSQDHSDGENKKNDFPLERKVELLFKKYKVMEDRWKKSEKDLAAYRQSSTEYQSSMDKITDSQKSDKRLLHSLREQLSALRSKVEVLSLPQSQPTAVEYKPAALSSSAGLMAVDGQLLKDLVAVRVREEMAKGIVSSNSSSSSSLATAVGNMGAVAGAFAPKDILQLRSDIEKLRTHQSFLDHIYTELKDFVSIREKKAEEAYRRSVDMYRTEMDKLLVEMEKRMKSVTSLYGGGKDSSESAGGGGGGSGGDGLGGLVSVCRDLQGRMEQCWTTVGRLAGDVQAEKERAQKEKSLAEKGRRDTDTAVQQISISVQQLSTQYSAYRKQMEEQRATNAQMIPVEVDLLAKSVDSLNLKFEGRTESLRAQAEESRGQADELRAQLSKLKVKVKQLSEGLVKSVGDTRKGIESVLVEIDQRAQGDARWSYDFTEALQRLQVRLETIESEVLHQNQLQQQSTSGNSAAMVQLEESVASLSMKQAGLAAANADLQAQLLFLQSARGKRASPNASPSSLGPPSNVPASSAEATATTVPATTIAVSVSAGGDQDSVRDSEVLLLPQDAPVDQSRPPPPQNTAAESVDEPLLQEPIAVRGDALVTDSIPSLEHVSCPSSSSSSSSSGRYVDLHHSSPTAAEALGLGSRLSDFHLLMEDVKLSIRALYLHLRSGDEPPSSSSSSSSSSSPPLKNLSSVVTDDHAVRTNLASPLFFSSPASSASSYSTGSGGGSGGGGDGAVRLTQYQSRLATAPLTRSIGGQEDSFLSENLSVSSSSSKKTNLPAGGAAAAATLPRRSPSSEFHPTAVSTTATTASIHNKADKRVNRPNHSPVILPQTSKFEMTLGATDHPSRRDAEPFLRQQQPQPQLLLRNPGNNDYRYDVNDSIFFHSEAEGDAEVPMGGGEEEEGEGAVFEDGEAKTSAIRKTLLAKKQAHRAKFRSDLAAMASNGSAS